MKALDMEPAGFRNFIRGKKTWCFGSGDYFKLFVLDFGDLAEIEGVIDNDVHKHGKIAAAGRISASVWPLKEAILQINTGNILIITASAYHEILSQLQTIPELVNTECYIYAKIKYRELKPVSRIPRVFSRMMIPPVIHYCWFGGKPLPEKLRKCIDSWKRFCPGYKIMEWNEENYNYRKNAWTMEAFSKKQWSYLADYARIDIIAAYGGIYLDTDVTLLQTLNPILCNKGFAATEAHGGVNLGSGFGAVPELPIIKELLSGFEREFEHKVRFCRNVGRETEVFWRHGYKLNGEFQLIEDVAVLPFNLFTPIIADTGQQFITEATVGVHYFGRSWKI